MSANHDRTDETYAEEHDTSDERRSREESRRRFPSIPVSPLGLWPSSTEEDAYRASHDEAYSGEQYGGATDEEARV